MTLTFDPIDLKVTIKLKYVEVLTTLILTNVYKITPPPTSRPLKKLNSNIEKTSTSEKTPQIDIRLRIWVEDTLKKVS